MTLDRSLVQYELLKTARGWDHRVTFSYGGTTLVNVDESYPIARLINAETNKSLALLDNFDVTRTYYRVTWVSLDPVPKDTAWTITDIDTNATKPVNLLKFEKKQGYYHLFFEE